MRYHSIKKYIIAHCGNNQKNVQMIMTAVLHDVWYCSRPLTYYYYISAGDLGTAMEWLIDPKYFIHILNDLLYKYILFLNTCQPHGIISN